MIRSRNEARLTAIFAGVSMAMTVAGAAADENLFGYLKGAETLPKGAKDFYQVVTEHSGKGKGTVRLIPIACWNMA